MWVGPLFLFGFREGWLMVVEAVVKALVKSIDNDSNESN